MKAVDAVAHLRRVLPDLLKSDQLTAEAAAALIDHVLQLEQALDLIRCGVTSALNGAPANAVLGVATRRR